MAPKVPAKDKKDCPPTKKPKIEPNTAAVQTGDGPSKSASSFVKQIEEKRLNTAKSVLEFKFNKKRCRVLSTAMEIPSDRSGGILYWMSRDQRVQDNWALLYAQRLALKHKLPLHVCFVLVPKFLEATIRHFGFILKGLQGVEEELGKLNIPFHLLLGEAPQRVPELVKKLSLNGVVTDFAPLRVPLTWVDKVKQNLPKDVPFCQVDAHNIVPCWVASEKQEVGARTIRKKIHDKLNEFLTEFPPVIKHPHNQDAKSEKIDWNAADASLEVNRTIKEVDWAKPGTQAALQELESFCTQRLKIFGDKRNDPNVKALSRLSPWLHYGQVSAQRCILEVKPFKSKYSSGVDAFIEEAVVRRELADNFCFYNKNYDNLDGAAAWARKTLDDHRKDKRGMLFNQEQLEEGKTHDDLWNAAQIQMVREGKMHGFLRMYWAKKILEWTESPEEALRIAIYLNDKYSLDGRDPNGYVGCMWSICGIHDQGWAEREVFGKIRYMNYQGCKRKFDVDAFVLRYGAKAYHYPQKKY